VAVAALGLLGYYLASFLDFLGLQYVGAGVGRLILFLYPTLVLLLSFLFLHKRPTSAEIAALVLSYLGIALVVAQQASDTPGGAPLPARRGADLRRRPGLRRLPGGRQRDGEPDRLNALHRL
jgi:drug/metabolite transporter (DMT)-like permease